MFSEFLLSFMAFFAIMNPIANLPTYMALVADDDSKISKQIAFKSLLIAFIIILVFILSGHLIFEVFGITISAFRIAGGLLVGMIGFHMINGVHSPTNKNLSSMSDDPTSVAISPLAMPLFAGPGTIVTAINQSQGGLRHQLITLGAFLLLCVLTYVILLSAKTISKVLGKNMMNIVTRLMGLILATIGIDMVLTGVKVALNL
ncbi:MarC family protein [Streptococcus sp. DD12]|uniref:MarC family protein n=1 Tax=Streptococcus sp. DD12 TaxID=1777880 RepID=UPI0007944E9D|nr:MarC family protein [Streptococcus sp. DD12]KXT76093.1 Multiple antibiotic resistance protein marC [Streptococcus sp. DD12]